MCKFRSVTLMTVAALCSVAPGFAQTELVLVSFGHSGTGKHAGYGYYPEAHLQLDDNGNLFGTASVGGKVVRDRFGAVFELARNGHRWHGQELYTFSLGQGGFPEGGIIRDGHGALFGTAALGGTDGCGMVFELKPAGSGWSERTLHKFSYGGDGCVPVEDLALDGNGDLYGVTAIGGADGSGSVYELAKSNGSWQEQILYSFTGGNDGGNVRGILMDASGDFFGTTNRGGAYGDGTVFQLTQSGGVWKETTLHSYGSGSDGDGGPSGALAEDAGGNLYGSEIYGGQNKAGAIFELSSSNGSWTETTLYSFTGGADGNNPVDGVTLAAGALYGVTSSGGAYGGGTVFALTQTGGKWAEAVLHNFPPTGNGDGSLPASRPILDKSGTIYGTTVYGGHFDKGAAYQIVP